MPPRETDSDDSGVDGNDHHRNGVGGRQCLFIVRHGDRWDYENPDWSEASTSRIGDPPLSGLGHRQARETGAFLDRLLAEEGIDSRDGVTWLSSPFLRCLQTSRDAMQSFEKIDGMDRHPIRPEYSVFEWDGKGGQWHASLPPISERIHYFPQLDLGYESMFVPEIPEPRSQFHARCDRAVEALGRRFPFRPRSAVVVVTHAAACISLARAATGLRLSDITPAGPCAVYKLTRSARSDDGKWRIDPHDAPNGLNGHTDHVSSMGGATVPWNHFGDKCVDAGYTGPPTSRFAPSRQP